MAKKTKGEYLAGRTDSDQMARVEAYITKAEITQADLVRKAVDEYMANHPIKDETIPAPSKVVAPGV